MIYRIADPPPGGKGLVGIYPDWEDDGQSDAAALALSRERYFSILFTRNYISQFFERIAGPLQRYGQNVDIVCGWDVEKLCMFYLPINPRVEIFAMSAIHFSRFDLLDLARVGQQDKAKSADIFFAASDRPDQLKNVPLLVDLLSCTQQSIRVRGYGRFPTEDLDRIGANPLIEFMWCGKASITDADQRLRFLHELACSRCLLVTSKAEGYCRLIGEALYLGVPVLLHAGVTCENWTHLNAGNCRLFLQHTFEQALADVLSCDWAFPPPVFEDGNGLLRRLFCQYLNKRNLPNPEAWHELEFWAGNRQILNKS